MAWVDKVICLSLLLSMRFDQIRQNAAANPGGRVCQVNYRTSFSIGDGRNRSGPDGLGRTRRCQRLPLAAAVKLHLGHLRLLRIQEICAILSPFHTTGRARLPETDTIEFWELSTCSYTRVRNV